MKCAICDVEIEVPEMDLCILCDSQRKYPHANVLGEGPNVSHLAPSGYGDAFRLAATIAVVILLAGLAVIL